MSRRNELKIFKRNSHLYLCILAVIVEQSVVALSTYFIVRLSSDISNGLNPLFDSLVFISLLSFAYLPSLAAHYELDKYRFKIYGDCLFDLSTKNYNVPNAFVSTRIREQKEAYVTNELWLIINDVCQFSLDIFTLILSILLNGAVIITSVNSSFLITYVMGLLIAMCMMYLQRRKVKELSVASQKNEVLLFRRTKDSIPNIWIGNAHNASVWKSHFSSALQSSTQTQIKLTLLRDSLTFLTIFLYCVPFGIVFVLQVLANLTNLQLLITLVSTLPRQVQILQYISVIVSYVFQLQEKVSKVKSLKSNLVFSEDELNSSGTINWAKLKLIYKGSIFTFTNSEELFKFLDKHQCGRFTLRGDNGSGKSSLLVCLKKQYENKACYIPAQRCLDFDELDGKEFSTGQAVQETLSVIQKLYSDRAGNLLLLDEWDANLDASARTRLSDRIDTLAENNIVIEVLHFSKASK